MKEERAFRATAADLLTAAAVSGYHRHKVEAATPEKISAVEEEVLPTAVALRLSGLALMLSAAAHVLNPRQMAWSSVYFCFLCVGRGRFSGRRRFRSRCGSSRASART